MAVGAFKLVVGVCEKRFQVGVRSRYTIDEVFEYKGKSKFLY